MNEDYRPSLRVRIQRGILKPLFHGIFNLLANVEILGLENIPPAGKGYVIAFNHVSKYDPPILVSHWTRAPEVLGAVEVWDRPGEGELARLWGGIPVKRGELDMAAVRRMVSVLRSGYPLVLAPEGGRSHQPGMQRGKPGITVILERTMVPVVPVGISGTTEDFVKKAFRFKKPRVTLNIGKPFFMPENTPAGLTPKEHRQAQVDFIMEKIALLLPEEYRGVYTVQVR